MKTIIGLTGTKGAGKTTAFGIMKAAHPELTEIQLAKKLKDVCASVFNVNRDSFDNPATKEKYLEIPVHLDAESLTRAVEAFGQLPNYDAHIRKHVGKILHSPREVAQYVGTEVLRSVDESIHCQGAVQGLPEDGIFVVTDLRFWNEYHFFANNPNVRFFPVFISNYYAEEKAKSDQHASERYVLEIGQKCLKIENNGSMDDFAAKVREFLKVALSKKEAA